MREFDAQLVPAGDTASWVCIEVPFDVQTVFGTKGRTAVAGAINGFPYRSSIFPSREGRHFMIVNREMRAGAKVQLGDTVRVTMARDTAPRVVEAPEELAQVLAADPEARAAFESFSYSHQREYAGYVAEAKRPETRLRRAQQTADALKQARSRKG